MKNIKYWLWIFLILPISASAWQWKDLWQTPDQQGSKLLRAGKPKAAAQVFKNRDWQGVSNYRAGDFAQALQQFSSNHTSDGQYNAGNSAAYMGKYQEALAAYEKAIALNPNNTDAIKNRDVIKKLLLQQQEKDQNQQDDKKQNQQENQKQNQQQKDSNSPSEKKDKNNSTSEQNNPKPNSPQENQTDKQKQQQQNPQQSAQNNSQNNKDQTKQANHSKPSQPDNIPQNKQQSMSSSQQKLDENNNQLFRRLTDDPGGLLQQKFMRDYLRRHGEGEILDQGTNNAFQ